MINNADVKDFIEDNSDEKQKEYLDLLITNSNSTSEKIDKLSLVIGSVVVLYFIADLKIVSSISLGSVIISDLSIAKLFTPLVFSFLLLRYALLNAHKAMLVKSIQAIGINYFTIRNAEEQKLWSNPFLQLILPFSFWESLTYMYFRNDNKQKCMSYLLTLPTFPIILSPFIFEYYALKSLIAEHWHYDPLVKIVVVLTIWILLAVLYYYYCLYNINRSINSEKV